LIVESFVGEAPDVSTFDNIDYARFLWTNDEGAESFFSCCRAFFDVELGICSNHSDKPFGVIDY
jgi:hypothetical protein